MLDIISVMTAAYNFMRRTIILLTILFAFTSFSFASPVQTYDELLAAIRVVQQENSAPIKSDVNQARLREAWGIGKLMSEHLSLNRADDDFCWKLFERLAKELNSSPQDLRHKIEFARVYSEVPKTIHLTWDHYAEIAPIHDSAERDEIARQAEVGKWSAKKLRKEIKEHQFKTTETEKALIANRLSELKMGKPGFYKIVKVNGELKAELGFDVYRDAPDEDLTGLEENQIVSGLGSFFGVEADAKRDDLYTYYAVVLDVVDGNTFHAAIDLGFGTTLVKSFRLRRVDAPELKQDFGEQAKAELENILKRGIGRVVLKIARGNDQDNYGRYLVDVFVNGKNIDQELVDSKLFTVRS